MGYRITKYQPTPNPNALKCYLSSPISECPRSFRSAADATTDPLAARLFGVAGVSGVLLNGDWMTVNKTADAEWRDVKNGVERVLCDVE